MDFVKDIINILKSWVNNELYIYIYIYIYIKLYKLNYICQF